MPAIGKDIIEDYVCYQTLKFLSNEVNIDKLSLAIHDHQKSKSLMVQNIEARIAETTKKMNNIISAIKARLDPTDLKSRYNKLKGLRNELEHSLDEEKCRNPVMNVEDIKRTLRRCKGISLNSLKEKKS